MTVAIVGAGPAGCVAALGLLRSGIEVTLIDPLDRPVGPTRLETLSGGADALLSEMMPPDAIAACRRHPVRTRKISWFEDQSFGAPSGTLVDRHRLDDALRRSAVLAGAQLVRDRVTAVESSNDSARVRFRSRSAAPLTVSFVIEARGRPTRSDTMLGPPRVALWMTVAPFGDGETRLVALPTCWAWAASTTEVAGLMIVLDPEGAAGLDVRAKRILAERTCFQADLLSDIVVDSRAPPSVVRATAGYGSPSVGARVVRIGDAALSYDPIAGQGLAHAIRSGAHAAPVIATILDPTGDHAAARRFLIERHREGVREHEQALVRVFHALPARTKFWSDYERTGQIPAGATPKRRPIGGWSGHWVLSDTARLASAPTLFDDRIVRAPVLEHDGLPRPVAFFNGIQAAHLHALLATPRPHEALVARLEPLLGRVTAEALLVELRRSGTLEPVRDHDRGSKASAKAV